MIIRWNSMDLKWKSLTSSSPIDRSKRTQQYNRVINIKPSKLHTLDSKLHFLLLNSFTQTLDSKSHWSFNSNHSLIHHLITRQHFYSSLSSQSKLKTFDIKSHHFRPSFLFPKLSSRYENQLILLKSDFRFDTKNQNFLLDMTSCLKLKYNHSILEYPLNSIQPFVTSNHSITDTLMLLSSIKHLRSNNEIINNEAQSKVKFWLFIY